MADDRSDDVQRVEGEGMTWVEIASVGTGDEALLLKGFLDAEGIEAQIEDVKFTEAPTTFGTMGDIRIYVSTEDEARAQQLLKERNEAFSKMDVDGDTVMTDDGMASIEDGAQSEAEPE
jgi:hypothetical protein